MARTCWLLLLCLCLLTGCRSAVPFQPNTPDPLPAAVTQHTAPTGDAAMEYQAVATLFLPRLDRSRLIAQQVDLTFSAARHGAETVVRALLSHPGNEQTVSLGHGVTLALAGPTPVEVSRDVCTVNLAPSCLQLDIQDFYILCQAITNTVTEFADIQYVNILVAGSQISLDVPGTLPAGTLIRRTSEDLDAIWNQAALSMLEPGQSPDSKRLTMNATLYFPSQGCHGILPEVRTITFDGQSASQLALGLLQELSLGPQYLENTPSMPRLTELLAQPPQVIQQPYGGGRVIALHFQSRLNEALLECDVTRSILMASLTYTLTTFVPDIAGIQVQIGDELIQQVTPISIYADQTSIHFANGQQRRSDYASFLMGYASLYFNSGAQLIRINRTVPSYETRNPRYLMNQLMLGSRSYDSVSRLQNPLPSGLSDADLIGFAVEGDTLLCHISEAFWSACQGMDASQERLMVYAMVNTLCAADQIHRVCFFVNGEQRDGISGGIYWRGEFLKNPGIIQPTH